MQSTSFNENSELLSNNRECEQFNNFNGTDNGDTVDMNTMLAKAVEDRNEMVSQSSLLQEFQNDIDMALNGSKALNQRLEALVVATKSFTIKRRARLRFTEIALINTFD